MNQFIVTNGTGANAEEGQLFSVRLIDRRTGEVPSLNGIPLSMLTHSPRAAIAAFMRGRDRLLWRAEVEPVNARDGGSSHGAVS
ncbi:MULTISPECIES: hypothetical protein [Paracoccus]|jgi:hypothetical protein|uniref:Uncharacterized protein n=1 Tax=Paracoccus denitrificans (strain Pd 1222) TaxID=318586 RepID=A1BCD7_PARDP|nr:MULTISPECIES: hypothetical protein [Paracoccus]ABL73181.1 hypothetical protein Pden_5121 [Paracoccus denitrificans PD1222]MBB4628663.1 hypothetical protein [Paracoccus denitrificans]MCU7429720.1 hypothetical protein [Paracoccus denitrificans]MDK8871337.1 hypothetical protein [Paracoccus sp. SSJ]QAR29559.1 hypothetical protein EO213_24765 [Paracoccus denitrificans]